MIGQRTILLFALSLFGVILLIICFQIARPSDPIETVSRSYTILRNKTSMPGIFPDEGQKALKSWIDEYVDIDSINEQLIGPSFPEWKKEEKNLSRSLTLNFLVDRFISLMPILATTEMKQQSITKESYTKARILIRFRQPGIHWTDVEIGLKINVLSWKIEDFRIENQSFLNMIQREIGKINNIDEFIEKISTKHTNTTKNIY